MPKKQKTVMLADGDIFAFNAASSSEFVVIIDEMYMLAGDMDQAKRKAKAYMRSVAAEIKADEIVFVWSCPTRHYWRHDIFPEYKASRSDIRSPLCLKELKLWLAKEFPSAMKPNMEADDLLGVLATNPKYKPNSKKIVVSADKDMMTLPVWQFNPDKDNKPWLQSLEEANKWHLAQTIGGDTTDGYPGCRGMSVTSAATFLDDPWLYESYEHTFKSGKRKGETEDRWRKAEPRGTWDNIVSLFIKAGQTEEDALMNAQMARICRTEDYDKGKVILWTPEKLK